MTCALLRRPPCSGAASYPFRPAGCSPVALGVLPVPQFAVRVRDHALVEAQDRRRAAMKRAFREAMDASGLCPVAVARALGVSAYSVEEWRKPSGDAPRWHTFVAAARLFRRPRMVEAVLPEDWCVRERG
jgi:hypothetical protein